MAEMVYFDRAAAAQMAPEAITAIMEFLKTPAGNPSALLHSAGMNIANYIAEARQKVARLINAESERIYFTSGATESNNLAIKGFLSGLSEGEIILSEIEHYSVLDQMRSPALARFNIKLLKVDGYGRVDPSDLKKLISARTVLVSVMAANPEIGTVEPIKELAQVCREEGVVFHTDATAAAGYIALDVAELGVNMMTLSAQNLGGPMGTGALYIDHETTIRPMFEGGNQESGYRPGTENVIGIVGFGAASEAVEIQLANESKKLRALGKKLWQGLKSKIKHIEFTGHPEHRLPGHVSFWHRFIEGESLLLHLNLKNVMAASGSACSSNLRGDDETDLRASHVLTAVGVPEEYCSGSITFSLGYYNTEDEVDHVISILPEIVSRLEAMSPVYADYIKKRDKNG